MIKRNDLKKGFKSYTDYKNDLAIKKGLKQSTLNTSYKNICLLLAVAELVEQQESLLDTVQLKSGTSQEAKAINLQQVKTQDGMNEYFDQNQPQKPQLETTDVEIAPATLQM